MDCVEVCPVDCFYEGENMLVIHPDECIDCGVCEPECPVDAIKADSEPGLEKWLSLNAEYARIWPNITVKKAPPPDSKEWEGKPDKPAAHEQDVSGVDLQEFLLWVLAPALRRHRRDRAFHDLEQGLLHALARDVAGD